MVVATSAIIRMKSEHKNSCRANDTYSWDDGTLDGEISGGTSLDGCSKAINQGIENVQEEHFVASLLPTEVFVFYAKLGVDVFCRFRGACLISDSMHHSHWNSIYGTKIENWRLYLSSWPFFKSLRFLETLCNANLGHVHHQCGRFGCKSKTIC